MNYKVTLTMLLCLTVAANAAFGQSQKLIAKTHATYRTNGSYTEDSTQYFHSGNKTVSIGKYKIPEFEDMADSIYVFKYNTTSKTLEIDSKTLCYYTGTDFDSSITYVPNGSLGWKYSLRTKIKYSGGKPDTVTYETYSSGGGGGGGAGWRNSSRIIYTWSSNNVATRLRQTYSFGGGGGGGAGWKNNRMWTYTYSGNNETSYIDQKWSSSGGGSWTDSFKRETTYAAGKISEVNTFKSSGSAWTPDTKNVYSRDGNSRLIQIKQDIYTGSAWEANRVDTNIYLANNTTAFPDTAVAFAFLFGNINNIGKWYYSYLSKTDGRYTNETSLSWDGTTAWRQTDGQDSINYWYYGWNLSVDEVSSKTDMVEIYPSPASNTINIKLDGIKDEQVHFVILDMQGKLMKNWIGKTQPVTTMSIDELPAGNYVLHIQGDTQVANKRFVVTK
ncbi:MAG: T9SS type A sorting domain-containing protein [Chitinophagales bacterium]|nr:T9SS type A sorting domain-containing protein [Chitinophagales bacterium]